MIATEELQAPVARVSLASRAPLILIVGIVLVSSAAPFVRFGDDSIALSPADSVDAAFYVMAWLPFLLAGFAIARVRHVRALLESRWLFVIGIALLGFVATAHTQLFFLLTRAVRGSPAPTAGVSFLVLTFLGALQYLMVVAFLAAELSGRAAERARLATIQLTASSALLRQELAEARIASLYAQLQPHFLFNTLNSISALVGANPVGARRMLLDLSSLLRAVLDNSERQLVPLEREIELLRSYLAIQQVRFGDRLMVGIVVEDEARTIPVPPMLLQPLAENAVHHAMNGDDGTATVDVTAFLREGRLLLEVRNSGAAPDISAASDAHGLGLRNTRERLRQLYGDDVSLTLEALPSGGGALARVSLPATAPTA